jgi:YYY domain-containing protein
MEYGYVVLWLATYLVLGLAALPIAATVFPRFHDRGAAFSITLALAVLGVVGFLVGHLAFGFVALLAGVAVLVGLSLWTGREVDVDIDRREYAEAAVVFSLAFLLVVAIRAVDPAVQPIGGEKFLDYGLLKSLLRSPKLPPEDMWFAGEPIRYYYAGHLVASLLAQLTFTPARYAYNLALAGFYGTLVTGVYGLAGAIADDHGAPRRLAAGLGAFFVGVASNFYVLGQVVLWLLPNGLARSLVGGTKATTEGLTWSPQTFSYWSASRVIDGTINEFPFFAWLNGDLHAHMASMGFTLLLLGLCYAYWRTPERSVTRRRFLLFGLLPPLAGFIGIVNGWSYPSAGFGLPVLTLALAPTSPRTLLPERVQSLVPDGAAFTVPGELWRYVTAFALAVGVFALSGAWVAPFWLIAPSTGEIAFFPGPAGLGELLVVHGPFLMAFVPYLAQRAVTAVERPLLVSLALGGVLVVGVLANAAAVGLFLPLLVVAWLLLRDRRDVGFETMLVVAGAGLVLVVEYVYVLEGVYGPGYRLNTVFKTYAQVWLFWAPAAGVALARLAVAGRAALPTPNAGTWRTVGRVLTVFLVFTTALYAGFALPQHFDRGSATSNAVGPTLDATAFLEVRHPDEAAAIRRIDRLEGRPTIVTAAPGGYRWQPSQGKGASAPASLTGVPTVAGWFHEAQYRSPPVYQQRVEDTETIYAGTDPAVQRELLARYDVEYVYVGPAERARYGTITVQQLDAVGVEGRYGDVVLLEVDQSKLDGEPTSQSAGSGS